MANPIPSCFSPLPSLFGCFQHYVGVSGSTVPIWNNITRVTDYSWSMAGPVSASGILPYARLADFNVCGGSQTCGAYTASNTTPICNQPTGSPGVDWIACSTASGFTTIDYNCYQQTTNSLSLASLGQNDLNACMKYAFKNLRSRHIWRGRYGYQSDQSLPPLSSSYFPNGVLQGNGGTLLNNSPDQTKYTNIDYNCTYTYYDAGNAQDIYRQNVTMEFPGYATLNSCFRQPITGSSLGPTGNNAAQLYLGYADKTLNDVVTLFTTADYSTIAANCSVCYSASYAADLLTITDIYPGSETFGQVVQTIYCDFFSNFQTKYWGFATVMGVSTFQLLETVTMNLTNTTLTLDITAPVSGAFQVSVTASLASPYTAMEAFNDCLALQDEYTLSDDTQYPPRSDELVTRAPLVYYSETYQPFLTIFTGDTCAYTQSIDKIDGNYVNGSVLGVPLPSPGYQRIWDGAHENYICCISEPSGDQLEAVVSYGAFSPSELPTVATKWTNLVEEAQGIPGSWIRFTDPLIEIQTFVEVPLSRPSWNFARPCGEDRWLIDPTTARCVQTCGTGSSFDVTIQSTTGINTNDVVFLYMAGGPATIQGVFVATKNSDTDYTLSSNKNWTTCPIDYSANANSFLAKMIFTTSPGICGNTTVLSAFQLATGSVQCTVTDGNCIQQGDSIFLYNVITGSSPINTTVSYSIDNNNFVVKGTSFNNYNGNGYAYYTTTPTFDWNDNSSKGYLLLNNWTNNFRDISQYKDPNYNTTSSIRYNQTLSGIPQSVNGISVNQACCGPNACSVAYVGYVTPDSAASGSWGSGSLISPIPSIQLDGLFGSLWQGIPIQFFTDIFWLPGPAVPCIFDGSNYTTTTCAWLSDDGSCESDTCSDGAGNLFYAQSPVFEAIQLTGPTFEGVTYPPLPAGYKIGYYTLTQIQSSSVALSASNCPIPPAVVGFNGCNAAVGLSDWGNLDRQNGCVCDDGRFAEEYEEDFAYCPLDAGPI